MKALQCGLTGVYHRAGMEGAQPCSAKTSGAFLPSNRVLSENVVFPLKFKGTWKELSL